MYMGKYTDIIKAIIKALTLCPNTCKSKCCASSECECGDKPEKNLIDEELENTVDNATV